MSMYPTKAPHMAGARDPLNVAPNAALLIDFDNVTMGMRSDLSKELKTLLNSDVIKGKVTVQRAYADWRRYPQYIVPLSEASIDLIFAPAYGSNKKNATDIRMAIDGIELVFIRPEIGTFILLTGDSDFSSLVLKLKEYGKYVIGVGIQESSSDILVQNCDEYYSYTSLSGLRKTTGDDRQSIDPWVLVERAVEQMGNNDDVMRSDRLKQVMVELDPGFDEGEYGFSKFSRFLTEASTKGLLQIRKLENGQYEVAPAKGGAPRKTDEETSSSSGGRGRRGRGGREARESSGSRARERSPEPSRERAADADEAPVADGPPLRAAYDLLRRSLERMRADGREPVRDSDVKRKMLELEQGFDEAKLGFSKFSRFLRQAADHGVIELNKRESGNSEVSLSAGAPARPSTPASPQTPTQAPAQMAQTPSRPAITSVPSAPAEPTVQKESALAALGRRFGLLLGAPKPPEVPPQPRAPYVEPASSAFGNDLFGGRPEEPQREPERRPEPEQRRQTQQNREPERRREPVASSPAPTASEPTASAPTAPARAENVLEQWKADFEKRSPETGRAAPERTEARAEAVEGADGQERTRERRPRGRRGRRGGRGGEGRGETAPTGQPEGDEATSEQPRRQHPQREIETVAEPRFEPFTPAQVVVAPPAREERPEPVAFVPPVREERPEPVAYTPPMPEERPAPAAPVQAEPSAGPAESKGELDGLEPSRLRGRTSKRRH